MQSFDKGRRDNVVVASDLSICMRARLPACLPAWRGIQREGGTRFSHFNCLINVIAKTGISVNLPFSLLVVVVTYLSFPLLSPTLDDVLS